MWGMSILLYEQLAMSIPTTFRSLNTAQLAEDYSSNSYWVPMA